MKIRNIHKDDTSEFCDRYIVIKDGAIARTIDGQLQHADRTQVLVKAAKTPPASGIWAGDGVAHIERLSPTAFLLTGTEQLDLKKVVHDLDAQELDVTSVEFYEKGIEEIFLEMVSVT